MNGTPPEAQAMRNPATAVAQNPEAESWLSLRGVRKVYGGHVVLDDISLDVGKHRCLVLIGASGSGKSTLLRTIDLLEEIDDGQILLGGQDITDPRLDANRIRARMGFVFQAFNLFGHLRVLENVALAGRVVRKQNRAQAEEAAMAMLRRVGLEDKGLAYPDQLSGGQQQRAAIARALVGDPEVLLLDEVTSALDPLLVTEVLDLLVELRAEGRTMVIATHEIAFARRVADEVCFLHQGRVYEHGPARQVIDDPQGEATRAFLHGLHVT